MMTRDQHVAWTKQRALDTLEATGDTVVALASTQSDLLAHPDTASHDAIMLGQMLAMGGHLSTPAQMREWIDGIN